MLKDHVERLMFAFNFGLQTKFLYFRPSTIVILFPSLMTGSALTTR